MSTAPLNIVILAAGAGTRMQSALPKVLHQIAGRSLLGHVVALADALAAANIVIVLAEDTVDQVRAAFGPRYQYVVQAERRGTGHAVQQAQPLLAHLPGDVLILFGDSPLLQTATAKQLVAARQANGALLALLSFQANPPTGYGRIVRSQANQVLAIIEERSATAEQRAIGEVNSGFMVADGPWLWQALPHVPRDPLKGEYYLTDLVARAVADGGAGSAIALETANGSEAWGCNDRAQLAEAGRILYQRTATALMHSGVTILDPATTYIDVGVAVGHDTTVLPGTILRGTTSIGAGCTIGPYTTIDSSSVGSGAMVRYAVLEQTTVAPNSQVGPFMHIRGEAAPESGYE